MQVILLSLHYPDKLILQNQDHPIARRVRRKGCLMKTILKKVPIPMAGLALGLAALGNLLQGFSSDIRLLCGAVSAILWTLVMIKIALFPEMIRKDLSNPIVASVSGTVFMTAMQLAVYAKPIFGEYAVLIWFAAISGHAALIVWFSWTYMRHLKLSNVYPTFFIAYVGIVVASVTAPQFGMEWLGMMIFRFGFAVYMLLLVLVSARYILRTVPLAARPLFCIYTAPMSLCLTGYLSVANPTSPVIPITMGILAQVLYALVLIRLPKLLRLPFFPSFAAFTFPFVITATGLKTLLAWLEGAGYAVPAILHLLVIAETLVAIGLVGYTLIRYLRHLSCGSERRSQALLFEECQWCCT